MKISKLRFLLSFGFLFFVMISSAQNQAGKTPFSIRLEPMEFQGFPKIQSFAYGEWNGKWVLIGGRIDGLHRRQPWAAFDQAGQNRRIYVIDPSTGKIWNKVLRELPVSLAEQLQSTNMQFVQKGDLLFITGGYGFSDIKNDHTTFPYLTIVDLPGLIQAIIDNTNLTQYFIQVKDSMMAVAGGRMAMSGDSLLLVGGHRFEGRYNPHGPDHGPGFVQEYTNEIRIFSTDITSGNCLINHINFLHDSINLHRRDYNLVPQVAEDNTQKFTIFSGVFQYGKDMPFTNLVDITSHGIQVVDSFQQKISHYHCAVMPMYDSGSKVMYSVFFWRHRTFLSK